ncbi:MAG TPA: hypothetical protein VFO40_18400 [Chthoniobacterales bacterium]|nr:hypothetical protein [Chthoniobacterales bacterium]
MANEQTMLTDQIRRIASRSSFRPFKLKTASGSEFTVPTRDHISFGPFGVAIGVWNEQGTACTWLSAANITEAVDEDPMAS